MTPAVDVHDADATKSLHSDHDPLWADVTVPLANAGGSDTVMVVGDSISQGLEGDYTWRYRLDEHLRAGGVNVNFAGPYSGTTRLPAELPPGFPQVSPPPHFSGVYRDGLAFDSDHFAQWGRQAHQAMHDVQSRVAEYQPNYLLVELGFNDLGWGVSNPDGLIADIKTLIANARTANPDIRILVANVLHRTPLAIQPDLGAKISAYNEKLGPALRSVNSTASPVHLVDIDTGYDPLADAYDGLHPNVFGEYKIARAFANVLATEFGLGGQFGAIGRAPALVPERSEWIRATPEPAGITVRWQHSFGADGYWLYQRDVTAGGQFERSALQIPADSWTVNWVVPGHTYDFYVIPTRGNYQADLPLALAS